MKEKPVILKIVNDDQEDVDDRMTVIRSQMRKSIFIYNVPLT